MGALICSEMGVDPAEMGLRLNQAQNVLTENQDAKMVFSKARGLRDLLGGFAYIVNDWLRISGYDWAEDWLFTFNGLSTEDKGFEADLRRKAIETDMTINESRKLRGEKPDPYGDIICNPQYVQYRIQKEQQEAMNSNADGMSPDGEGAGGGDFNEGGGGDDNGDGDNDNGDDDIDDIVDEAMDSIDDDDQELKKAIILI